MFKHFFIHQLKYISYCLQMALWLSFWDKKQAFPSRPLFVVPGFILGIPLGIMTFMLVTGFRVVYENLSSMFIAFLLGFRDAQQRLRLKSLAFPDDTNRSSYQRLLGFLAKISYFPGYLFGIAYGVSIQLILSYSLKNCMDCISFFWNLSIYDLRQVVNENSNSVIGSKNFFGIFGYLCGVFIGVPLALMTVVIRFLVEFMPGLKLGLNNQTFYQDSTSSFQDALRLPSYALGFILYSNLKVFTYLQVQGLILLFRDKMSHHYAELKPNLWQVILGGFSGIIGLPVVGMVCLIGALLRLGLDSSIGFRQSLAAVFDSRQNTESSSLFGLPGRMIGYVVGVCTYLLSIPLLACYKWVEMLRLPRFQSQEREIVHPQLEALKSLYGMLNNYQRQFPKAIPSELPKNSSGGKGSYCFISKVIHLNQPSVSEIYLDEVLLRQHQQQHLEPEVLTQIHANLLVKFGMNPADKSELDHAHRVVCKFLAP